MVKDGGIREQDIVLCEPSRAITDSIYNKVHREFPQVRFIDNLGGEGREKCEYFPEMIAYSQDNGKLARGLAKCIVDADYLINSSLLKTHVGPGVTLTTKNLYGATDISLFWRNNAHNGFSQDKRHGRPGYKTFVDWLAHKHLGQKVLLSIIDGTYGSPRQRQTFPQVAEGAIQQRLVLFAHRLSGRGGLRCRRHGPHYQRVAGV